MNQQKEENDHKNDFMINLHESIGPGRDKLTTPDLQSNFATGPGKIIFTLLGPMEFSIKFDTVKSEWSIVYTEGSQVVILKKIVFLSLKINFVLEKGVDPDEMQHNAAFHLGLHCFSNQMLMGSLVFKVLMVQKIVSNRKNF